MQFSSEIIKVLEYLGEKIGVTIDWTSANVLPYLEQLCKKFITWEINTSIAWIVIAGVVFVLTLIFAILVNCWSDWDGIEWFIFGITTLISIAIIVCQVFDIIECQTFPEKAIYEYIQLYLNN